jgi:hypothetical protein
MILNLNKNPTKRDITWFAMSLALFFGALGGLVLWRPDALVGVATFLAVAWLISLIINRDAWHLQILGAAMPLLFFAIGGSAQVGGAPWTVAITTWIVGIVLTLASCIWLKLGRLLYSGWMLAAFPIGWTISHLILGITYYLVLTPIGLLMRLVGRDPMQRSFDRSAQTYWVKHETPTDPSRYFQQF